MGVDCFGWLGAHTSKIVITSMEILKKKQEASNMLDGEPAT